MIEVFDHRADVRTPTRGVPGAVAAALKATVAWLGALVVVAMLFSLTSTPLTAGYWSALGTLSRLVGWAGLLLPFVAFAGGAVVGDWPRVTTVPAVAGLAVLLAVVTYGTVAFADPTLDNLFWQERRTDVTVVRPFQPQTPGAIIERRAFIEANPPAEYNRSVDTPLAHPPNVLTHSLHWPAMLAVFAMLNVLLGLLASRLTGSLSPPARRNALWALGLLGGVGLFAAMVAGDAWVSSSIEASGVLGAWLPLSVPLVEGAVLLVLARRRGARHNGPSSAS